jgi:hypothetical protein
MKRARFSERADHQRTEGSRGWCEGHRAMSAARDLGRHFLHQAEQVRRSGSVRDAAAAPTRGREPAAEIERGRPGAGYSGAQGRACKKRLRPAVKRQMGMEVMTTHDLSQRRAGGLIGITRRGLKRASAEDRNRRLRQRLRELAEQRRRWGCPRLYLVLRREGWRANHKRVERLYREEGLSLRRRRRRKRLSHLRVARERPLAVNQTWAVDLIHDSLISGRHFRAFAVLDQWSRASLAIAVDLSLTGERVTTVYGCSSSNRASRSRTRTSRASTRGCATNALMSTFSFRSPRRGSRSKSGASSTTGSVPIRAWAT